MCGWVGGLGARKGTVKTIAFFLKTFWSVYGAVGASQLHFKAYTSFVISKARSLICILLFKYFVVLGH